MAIIRPGRQARPKLAEIGRLFKGAPRVEGERPSDLDYFRFEPNESLSGYPRTDGEPGTLYDELSQRYLDLDSQRVLRIRFPFDEIEQVLSKPINESWSSKGGVQRCIRRCDGEQQLLHYQDGPQGPRLSKNPIPCAAGPNDTKCPLKCVPTSRLQFILSDLGYPGIVVHTSHAIFDINEFEANLEVYRGMPLSKIPFLLCRRLKPCNYTNDQGQVIPQKKWLCHIEVDPTYGIAMQQQAATNYLASLGATVVTLQSVGGDRTMPMLPDSDPTLDDDCADVHAVTAAVVEDDDEDQSVEYTSGAMLIYCDRVSQLTDAGQIDALRDWALTEKQFDHIVDLDFSGDSTLAREVIDAVADDRKSEVAATTT